MAKLSKRTTVYFEPNLHQQLKSIANASSVSVSKLIDQAARLLIEGERNIVKEAVKTKAKAKPEEKRPGNLAAVQKFAAHAESPYKPDISALEEEERSAPTLPEVKPSAPKPGEAAHSYGAMLRKLKRP